MRALSAFARGTTLILLSAAIPACGKTPTEPERAVLVPALIAPPHLALMDNGCQDFSNPIIWDFAWSAVPGATRYHLYVIASSASIPVIDNDTLTETTFRSESMAYTGVRFGWTWRVRARVAGAWRAWSPTGAFDVEPVDTDCR
jgi:hypothetical protein